MIGNIVDICKKIPQSDLDMIFIPFHKNSTNLILSKLTQVALADFGSPLVLLPTKTFKLFGFPIFRYVLDHTSAKIS